MGFINTQSALIYDSKESIHHLYIENNKLIYIYADALTKKVNTSIIQEGVKEFDAAIEANDEILIMSTTKENRLILTEVIEGKPISHVLEDQIRPELRDIHIFGNKDSLSVIYTIPDHDNDGLSIIMQSRYNNGEWENKEIAQYFTKGLLKNEVKVIIEEDGAYLVYIEYQDHRSILYVKKYDGVIWHNDILKVEIEKEVYWFDIQKKQEGFDFLYSFKEEGQFGIAYESYTDKKSKVISRHILSDYSNNMHPILLTYKEEQWAIWTEMDAVLSCRIIKQGRDIDGPYKWKDSKTKDFVKCKFSYNNDTIKEKLGIKCNSVFSTFPEYSLLGFGSLKGHVEAVLVNKKKEGELIKSMNQREENNDSKDKQIKKAEKASEISIPQKIDLLEKRIENIENYLSRRSRMFGPKR